MADAVHLGGIEERHAELESAVDGRDRLRVVAFAVRLAHPHATEAQLRNLESLLSELPLLEHDVPSFRRTDNPGRRWYALLHCFSSSAGEDEQAPPTRGRSNDYGRCDGVPLALVARGEQVHSTRSRIGHFESDAARELPLDIQVPLLHVRVWLSENRRADALAV